MKIGIFSDSHEGNLEERIAERFVEEKVDMLIGLGDYGDEMNTSPAKITKALSPFCKTQIPFLAIPGNYESMESWNDSLNSIQGQLIDGVSNPIFTLGGINFISVPGNVPDAEPFFINLKEKISKSGLDLSKSILVSHYPPRQIGRGTDYSVFARNLYTGEEYFGRTTKEALALPGYRKSFRNSGSGKLANFIQEMKINFVFSGHIHEAFGGFGREGNKILPQILDTDYLYLNPGPARNGIYAIVNTKLEEKLKLSFRIQALNALTYYEGLFT